MAIQILPQKAGLGKLFGTGLGTGLSTGLQMLAKQKIEGLQKRDLLSSLMGANVPENVARAISGAPKGLQREMFKPLMALNKTLKSDKGGSMSDFFSLRKKLLSQVKKGKINPEVIREKLVSQGVLPEEIDVLLGKEINDDIVRFFLDKTNNNPKKARLLAKKFGYKV